VRRGEDFCGFICSGVSGLVQRDCKGFFGGSSVVGGLSGMFIGGVVCFGRSKRFVLVVGVC
jgi:hypothetical protein